jgi:hypothetical protein
MRLAPVSASSQGGQPSTRAHGERVESRGRELNECRRFGPWSFLSELACIASEVSKECVRAADAVRQNFVHERVDRRLGRRRTDRIARQ